MKPILSFCLAAFAGVIIFAGCKSDPNSSIGVPEINRATQSPTSDAHPAIAYRTNVSIKGKDYRAVGVMDDDGTDQTIVYTSTGSVADVNDIFPGPSWSPDGGTLAFYIYGNSVTESILLRDVAVSHGKVVGSNTRTLYTMNPADGNYIRGMSWCSLSSTGKIAFTTHAETRRLFTIPTSGGTPTLLYSIAEGSIHFWESPTWSPDDSKIAFVDHAGLYGTAPDTIRVIDAVTGQLLESIGIGSTVAITNLEWSRTGSNLLAFTANYGSGSYLYYVSPTTGSTPTTNNVSAQSPTWSPTNAFVASISGSTLQKTVTGTATTSTIATGIFASPRWKR
jgi:Tol biopolymer transport system component